MQSEWTTRRASPADEDFLVYSWLKSYAHSRHGRAVGAYEDASEAERRYWDSHRSVVLYLLGISDVTVVCDPESSEVIWAWSAMTDDAVHYVLAKRRFHREGLSADMFRALLSDRLDKPSVYTHELVELRREEVQRAGLRVPSSWTHDEHWIARHLLTLEARP